MLCRSSCLMQIRHSQSILFWWEHPRGTSRFWKRMYHFGYALWGARWTPVDHQLYITFLPGQKTSCLVEILSPYVEDFRPCEVVWGNNDTISIKYYVLKLLYCFNSIFLHLKIYEITAPDNVGFSCINIICWPKQRLTTFSLFIQIVQGALVNVMTSQAAWNVMDRINQNVNKVRSLEFVQSYNSFAYDIQTMNRNR